MPITDDSGAVLYGRQANYNNEAAEQLRKVTEPGDEEGGEGAGAKIGINEIRKATETLRKYKAGKAALEAKIKENEQFWKLKHWEAMQPRKKAKTPPTAWLWNVIVAKHADMMDSYPEPAFFARNRDDEPEADRLTSIVPVILEQNDFHDVYDDCAWYKLKQGASCYGVFWDGTKLGGMGDISVRKIDLLNLFWEPGITDIQDSRNVFSVEAVDNDLLEQRYPQLKGKLGKSEVSIERYIYDDHVDTSEKTLVIDWYYHTEYNGQKALHYVKYAADEVLFATENEPEKYPDGWYAHAKYPFVVDSLYDIEGSIVGYGFIDICKPAQIQIDLLSDAAVKNARIQAQPRFFVREDGSINVEEFADLDNEFVHVTGNLGEDSIRQISGENMSGSSITILQSKIDELKETSGNRDVQNGSSQSGVTAASAIAALQEAAGKTSRDMINTTYQAYKELVFQCVELIREFYDIQRQFRIANDDGKTDWVNYDNSALKPQAQGWAFGEDMGYRVPQFDIDVSPQKSNPYNKMSQNELALQLFQMGFFNPQMTDQSLACLSIMDFQTKDEIERKISENGTMYQQLQQFAQVAYELASQFAPDYAAQIAQMMQAAGIQAPAPGGAPQEMPEQAPAGSGGQTIAEDQRMSTARAQAQEAAMPRQ